MNRRNRNWLSNSYTKISLGVIIILILFLAILFIPQLLKARITSFNSLPTWEVGNPVSSVFVMDSIPQTSGSLAAGDSTVPDAYLSDPAIDTLLLMMETRNIYFHKTSYNQEGIVGSNNIVIIKGNFLFTSRLTTSTDRIKGIIWKILQHPEGFSGEIIVCDNTQELYTSIGEDDNNSEDEEQSIIDVVNTFSSKGYPVYVKDWNYIWDVVAGEYSTGDYNDGYVYEPDSKISYPKFRTPSGNYNISLHHGIWDSLSQSYDKNALCIIDFPVLKAHSMAGASIAIKNWIGVLTTAYQDERYGGSNPMHYDYLFGDYALVAKVMGLTFPKLVIVDAAWTSTKSHRNLSYVVNTKMLLGSTDPAAISWYAAKYILTPIAVTPLQTDPDNPGGDYNLNIVPWASSLQDSGFACTIDSIEMSVYDRNTLSITSENNLTENIAPKIIKLHQNYPNPFNPSTIIKFQIPELSFVSLKVYDVLGNEVARLVNREKQAGEYEINFSNNELSSGIYLYQLKTNNFLETKKMILLR